LSLLRARGLRRKQIFIKPEGFAILLAIAIGAVPGETMAKQHDKKKKQLPPLPPAAKHYQFFERLEAWQNDRLARLVEYKRRELTARFKEIIGEEFERPVPLSPEEREQLDREFQALLSRKEKFILMTPSPPVLEEPPVDYFENMQLFQLIGELEAGLKSYSYFEEMDLRYNSLRGEFEHPAPDQEAFEALVKALDSASETGTKRQAAGREALAELVALETKARSYVVFEALEEAYNSRLRNRKERNSSSD